LPTGKVVDRIADIKVSCVDVANPCVFVRAKDIGIDGTELPDSLNSRPGILQRLEDIRQQAAVAMGICKEPTETPRTIPKVGIVSKSAEHKLLSKRTLQESEVDFVVRFLSDTQPHRAIPLTASLCTAAAAKIKGSLVQQCLGQNLVDPEMITIGHPSGRIQVNAAMNEDGGVQSATVYRTSRSLMEGRVFWS
jgi:2-methylaconitate cis-trans-isomerase PrpF